MRIFLFNFPLAVSVISVVLMLLGDANAALHTCSGGQLNLVGRSLGAATFDSTASNCVITIQDCSGSLRFLNAISGMTLAVNALSCTLTGPGSCVLFDSTVADSSVDINGLTAFFSSGTVGAYNTVLFVGAISAAKKLFFTNCNVRASLTGSSVRLVYFGATVVSNGLPGSVINVSANRIAATVSVSSTMSCDLYGVAFAQSVRNFKAVELSGNVVADTSYASTSSGTLQIFLLICNSGTDISGGTNIIVNNNALPSLRVSATGLGAATFTMVQFSRVTGGGDLIFKNNSLRGISMSGNIDRVTLVFFEGVVEARSITVSQVDVTGISVALTNTVSGASALAILTFPAQSTVILSGTGVGSKTLSVDGVRVNGTASYASQDGAVRILMIFSLLSAVDHVSITNCHISVSLTTTSAAAVANIVMFYNALSNIQTITVSACSLRGGFRSGFGTTAKTAPQLVIFNKAVSNVRELAVLNCSYNGSASAGSGQVALDQVRFAGAINNTQRLRIVDLDCGTSTTSTAHAIRFFQTVSATELLIDGVTKTHKLAGDGTHLIVVFFAAVTARTITVRRVAVTLDMSGVDSITVAPILFQGKLTGSGRDDSTLSVSDNSFYARLTGTVDVKLMGITCVGVMSLFKTVSFSNNTLLPGSHLQSASATAKSQYFLVLLADRSGVTAVSRLVLRNNSVAGVTISSTGAGGAFARWLEIPTVWNVSSIIIEDTNVSASRAVGTVEEIFAIYFQHPVNASTIVISRVDMRGASLDLNHATMGQFGAVAFDKQAVVTMSGSKEMTISSLRAGGTFRYAGALGGARLILFNGTLAAVSSILVSNCHLEFASGGGLSTAAAGISVLASIVEFGVPVSNMVSGVAVVNCSIRRGAYSSSGGNGAHTMIEIVLFQRAVTSLSALSVSGSEIDVRPASSAAGNVIVSIVRLVNESSFLFLQFKNNSIRGQLVGSSASASVCTAQAWVTAGVSLNAVSIRNDNFESSAHREGGDQRGAYAESSIDTACGPPTTTTSTTTSITTTTTTAYSTTLTSTTAIARATTSFPATGSTAVARQTEAPSTAVSSASTAQTPGIESSISARTTATTAIVAENRTTTTTTTTTINTSGNVTNESAAFRWEPIEGEMPAATAEAVQTTAASIAVITSVAAPTAAVFAARALSMPAVATCTGRNADGERWIDAQMEFPMTLFPSNVVVGGTVEDGGRVRAALISLVVAGFAAAFVVGVAIHFALKRPLRQILMRVFMIVLDVALQGIGEAAGMLLSSHSGGASGGLNTGLAAAAIVLVLLFLAGATALILRALVDRKGRASEQTALPLYVPSVVLPAVADELDGSFDENSSEYSRPLRTFLDDSTCGRFLFTGNNIWEQSPSIVAPLVRKFRSVEKQSGADRATPFERVRGTVSLFSYISTVTLTFLSAIFAGVAKVSAKSCPTMLALIAVVSVLILLSDIVLRAPIVPVRRYVLITTDAMLAVIAIAMSAVLGSESAARANPDMVAFVAWSSVVAVFVALGATAGLVLVTKGLMIAGKLKLAPDFVVLASLKAQQQQQQVRQRQQRRTSLLDFAEELLERDASPRHAATTETSSRPHRFQRASADDGSVPEILVGRRHSASGARHDRDRPTTPNRHLSTERERRRRDGDREREPEGTHERTRAAAEAYDGDNNNGRHSRERRRTPMTTSDERLALLDLERPRERVQDRRQRAHSVVTREQSSTSLRSQESRGRYNSNDSNYNRPHQEQRRPSGHAARSLTPDHARRSSSHERATPQRQRRHSAEQQHEQERRRESWREHKRSDRLHRPRDDGDDQRQSRRRDDRRSGEEHNPMRSELQHDRQRRQSACAGTAPGSKKRDSRDNNHSVDHGDDGRSHPSFSAPRHFVNSRSDNAARDSVSRNLSFRRVQHDVLSRRRDSRNDDDAVSGDDDDDKSHGRHGQRTARREHSAATEDAGASRHHRRQSQREADESNRHRNDNGRATTDRNFR